MADTNEKCELGMVGLGVMGRNLVFNMADHGFSIAGYDTDTSKLDNLRQESEERPVKGASTIPDFIQLLRQPRAIMLLVPAGAPVDIVINELLPYLQSDDLIIDAGNSHFTDTNRRAEFLQKKGIQFLGVGISGGEEGARRGPSIMPGGPKAAYERVRPIFEAVAAKVKNEPCVTYLGNGSVGHYVKMVHNGIEYGIMQLIAESYDLLKRGLGLNNKELCALFQTWNESELNSYLIEITAQIFGKRDEKTTKSLIDEIVAVAQQNGTGMWTSQSGMELQLPVPVIDVAVAMRDLSVFVKEREAASQLYQRPIKTFSLAKNDFIQQLQAALFTGMIVVYAQGMALLRVASLQYDYHLDLEAIARIWRGGCIIRAGLLDDIRTAFHRNPHLPNLLLDSYFSETLTKNQEALRQVVCQASLSGIPIPALMATLAYLDAYRSSWLPANLIQAQRDYFGAHRYERTDATGSFHTEWEEVDK